MAVVGAVVKIEVALMNELSQFVEKKAMVQVEGDWQFRS